jgi:hypothetical protein
MTRFLGLRPAGVLVVVALGFAAGARAADRADPGVITLATDVRTGPSLKDQVVATVPAGLRVTVLEMAGAGARIEAGKVKGWVPATKVRIGDGSQAQAASAGGGSFFRDMTALLGGGRAEKDVKVTAGARGLTPGALEGASPNPAARQRMEALQVSQADARGFARRVGLTERDIPYLASGGGGSGGGFFKGLTTGAPAGRTGTKSPDR